MLLPANVFTTSHPEISVGQTLAITCTLPADMPGDSAARIAYAAEKLLEDAHHYLKPTRRGETLRIYGASFQ
ncbi:MAG: hypothetical protein GC129_07080 [Proteobacteria bacterium]|nr:hypothetical protein [Pseudomonadota bacterium]